MILNPIIPIWLMSIISAILIFFIIHNKSANSNNNSNNDEKKGFKKIKTFKYIDILIIILLFAVNSRIMLPNGESNQIASELNVLFVIDKSVSMRALDYDGNKERLEGVINDCCYIIDELNGSKFSIITFGDTAQKLIPFTSDGDMAQAQLKAIQVENDSYASGTSINIVKDEIENTLSNEQEKHSEEKYIIYFVTDGEITKEEEKLESFSNISKYISDGAVLGYGTSEGGKMINSLYEDNPYSEFYYKFYYDNNYNSKIAISKIDENNLNSLASDMGIEYIHMTKTSKLNSNLKRIKTSINNENSHSDKIKSYQDVYYIFAIPLVVLLIVRFIIIRRKII